MLLADSQLNGGANKRSLAADGLLGAEKSQKQKLDICWTDVGQFREISMFLVVNVGQFGWTVSEKMKGENDHSGFLADFDGKPSALGVFSGGESESGIHFSF